MKVFSLHCLLAIAIPCAFSGCASVPREQGLAGIQALVDQRNRITLSLATDRESAAMMAAKVQALLQQPLTPDAAVQIALLRNPRMQSEYARLGIAQADVYEASRVGNPAFFITALHHSGDPAKLDAGISTSFADLLLLSARKHLAAMEYARTQQLIGAAILNLVSDTRAAYYTYVGAQQVVAMRSAVATAAQTAAELAAKFYSAGNVSALECKLREVTATQARLESARANTDVMRARSTLNRMMGLLDEDGHWKAAERLPVPLTEDESADTLIALAHQQRLDLAAARQEVALFEQKLAVTKRYRWFGKVDIGVNGERETDRSKLYGPSLSLQVPIFNQGQGAIARVGAWLDDAYAQLRALQLDIDSAVRLNADRVNAARAITQTYRAALIPQREAIVARTQDEVNFMLAGVFELLLTKQQEFDAYQGYIEAVRDYWLARVDLMRAVGAQLPSDSAVTDAAIGPDEILHPAPERSRQPAHPEGDTHDQHGEAP